MLKDILSSQEKKEIASKHTKALMLFSDIYNNKKSKCKHKYLYPIKEAGFSLSEARYFNFRVGKKLWKSCLIRNQRNKGGIPKLNQLLVNKIRCHLNKNSSIAANRYLKLQNENARYRHTTIIQAYNTFAEKDKLSFSSFYKYLENIFKKPHRISDLCDYCEHKKVKIIFICIFFLIFFSKFEYSLSKDTLFITG